MRRGLLLTTVTAAALAAVLWPVRTPIPFAALETTRLRAHFDSVERELRARDVPGLTPTQRAARVRLLNILRSYRLRGIFPRNTDFPNRDMPVFIDYWGKRCGVAFLMEQTGNEAMVLRIAAMRNNARVPELKDDPEVGRWLTANGITLAEATRIQPTYGCGTVHGGPCPVGPGYKLATAVVLAGNVTAVGLNVAPTGLSPQTGGALAMGTGLAGIFVGGLAVGDSGARGTLGIVNVGVGATTLMLGIIRLATNATPESQSRVSVGPWFGPRATTGLAARVVF